MPAGEIANRCGISLQDIINLKIADHYHVSSVKKLCDYFNIDRPKKCLKDM